MAQYLPVVALFVLGTGFAAINLVASRIVAPGRPTEEKLAPYECGIVPGREPPHRFPVRFYLIAMLFIVFDIEIVFLYPWAVAHAGLGRFGLIAILIFSALVFESFLYLVSKGALDWGTLQVNRRQSTMVSAERTVNSTVRRVGMEGRYDEVEIIPASEVVRDLERGDLERDNAASQEAKNQKDGAAV